MLKINCPECGKQFIWTDDRPPQGTCPNDGCDWQYDVRKEIGKGIAKRANASPQASFSCPECGSPLNSGWMRCSSCGTLILASRSIEKRHVAFASMLLLVLLTFLYLYIG